MESKVQRRGLGRGLSALMADINLDSAPAPAGVPSEPRRSATLVPVENIHPNPDQPRRIFDQTALDDLAASVKAKGVLMPLIVRPSRRKAGHFEIVAGERRWRASQLARLHELPVLVRDFDDTEVLEVAIIENIQRADLNPVEEAAGYRQLMDRFGHTQEKLAEALSRSRSHIANLLRLLTLPSEVQDMLQEGKISAGHARTLVGAAEPLRLAREIVDNGYSVREAERLARETSTKKPRQAPIKRSRSDKDADTRALEADLSASLGMPVTILHETGKENGVISIRYTTLDQLDALCGALAGFERD